MSKDQSRTIMQVMSRVEGVTLREKCGGTFHFRFHMTDAMSRTDIEALDLTVRAYNCMKRAGYNTVGDIANAIAEGVNIRNIRNCGTKSAREIMEKLFLFQYDSLPEERREKFLVEVLMLNNY